MADLEYKIKTVADLEALKQSQRALKESAGASDELSQSTENLKEKKRDLIAQLKALRHEVPFVAQALELVRHPITAAAIAVSFAIDAWKKYIDTFQEATRQSAAIGAMITPINHFKQAALESALHAQQFAEELGRIGTQGSRAAESLAKLVTQQQTLDSLQDEKKNAHQRLEKANVHERLARGQITSVAAERELAGIDLKYERLAESDRLARLDRGIAAHSAAASGTTAEIFQGQAALTAANANVTGLDAEQRKRVSLQTISGGVRSKNLADIEAEIKKIQDTRQSVTLALATSVFGGDEEIDRNLAAIEQELEQEKRFIQEAPKHEEETRTIGAKALEKAIAERDRIEQRLKSLKEQRDKENATVAELSGTRGATASALADIGPTLASAASSELTSKEIGLGVTAAQHFTTLGTELNSTRERRGEDAGLVAARREEARLLKELNVTINSTLEGMLRQIKGLNSQVQNPQ